MVVMFYHPDSKLVFFPNLFSESLRQCSGLLSITLYNTGRNALPCCILQISDETINVCVNSFLLILNKIGLEKERIVNDNIF